MAEIKNREERPLPGIEYSEIFIPDENDIGTGTFTTVLEQKALAKINPIMSSIINAPEFQLIVNINSAEEETTVLLGKADNTPAVSRKVFTIPEDTKIHEPHNFKVFFSGWNITALELDGNALEAAG
ncbi:MAG: hypothetical protein C4526_08205 [Nitrospiraceae bacterium]|nr:MAG: hypothetical protein C4526_08205 [Nitrospiraceae bacterium]